MRKSRRGRPLLHEVLERMWIAIRGPARPPRVTDDDDDGLARSRVPRRPKPVAPSGTAACEIPVAEPQAGVNAVTARQ
jgi:hypothetical protein